MLSIATAAAASAGAETFERITASSFDASVVSRSVRTRMV